MSDGGRDLGAINRGISRDVELCGRCLHTGTELVIGCRRTQVLPVSHSATLINWNRASDESARYR
jgi:hypothetical protein